MADSGRNSPNWLRWSGIGFEFAAAVAGFTFLGYWIDQRYDSGPKGVLFGAILGLIGGTYNLIRSSLIATREAEREAKSKDRQKK